MMRAGGFKVAPEIIDLRGFAAIINSRLAIEARIAKAVGFGWLCGGAAIASILTGLGVAAALYGYSFMLSVKPAGDPKHWSMRCSGLK
jgi:predicted phage tail protein